jgi:hypothetical protein
MEKSMTQLSNALTQIENSADEKIKSFNGQLDERIKGFKVQIEDCRKVFFKFVFFCIKFN